MARVSPRRTKRCNVPTSQVATPAAVRKGPKNKKSKSSRGLRRRSFPASPSPWSDSQENAASSQTDGGEAPSHKGVAAGRTTLAELQAVVINLDRRPDRMEACAASCDTQCPWLSYTRLAAVDGKKDEIKLSEVTMSWYTGLNCVYQKIRSKRKGWNDLHTYVPRELKLSPGERGCSLSHVRAWRHCLELGRPLMVLEDDAMLMPEFTPVLSRALAALPGDAQVLYLGYSQAAPWRRELTPELVESEYVWTTVGYVIWPSGARHFVSQLPVNQPVDNWMASQCAKGHLKAYAVRPKIVRQAEEWNVKSDVAHSDERLGHMIQATAGTSGGRINMSHNTHHSVDLWSDSATNQQWAIKKTVDGLYTIQTVVPTSGGRVYLSHDTHHSVDLWCDAGDNQRWRIQKIGADSYTIQAAAVTSEGRTYLGCNGAHGVELFEEAAHWVIRDFELE